MRAFCDWRASGLGDHARMSIRRLATSAALAVCLLAALVAAGVSQATPRTASEPHIYWLKAALVPRFVTTPPVGVRPGTRGTFSAKLDLNWRRGEAFWPHVRLSGLTSSPAVVVHIHAGKADTTGRVLYTLCGQPPPGAPGPHPDCTSPFSYFNWLFGLRPLIEGPTYVDVHTKRNLRGELRGQVVVTIGRSQ